MALICSAALPSIAGQHQARRFGAVRGRCSRSADDNGSPRAAPPETAKQLQQAAREHPDRHAHDRVPDQTAPAPTPTATEPTLKKIDAIAGMPKRSHAFSSPMACAAKRDQQEEREHDARQQHGEFELARHVFEARRHQPHQLRREDHSRRANGADHEHERGGRKVRKLAARRACPGLQVLREDRDERRGERPFGEQVARQVRDAHPEQEGVVNLARAEQPRHHHLAHHARDPA